MTWNGEGIVQLLSRVASLVELANRPGREKEEAVTETAIQCLDLTTLSETGTHESVRALCERAIVVGAAAVCVSPRFVQTAADSLAGTDVRCASVAMHFPDASGSWEDRLSELHQVVAHGADEVDIVVPVSLIQQEKWDALATEVEVARDAASDRVLKVILETGNITDPHLLYHASRVVLDQGADFLKTSTGKTEIGATIDAAATMILAIDDHGKKRGLKISGGLRTLEDITPYYRLVHGLWSERQLTPRRFRIGASSLLDALIRA